MFICFEGIDGAGKSTQARLLHQRLTAMGRQSYQVADPGTTMIGKAIRELLLATDTPINPKAQMLLFSAARAELAAHISEQPPETVIICDRWLLSTLIYQGVINGIEDDLILSIFRGTSNVVPDVCVLLDIAPEAAAERAGPPRDRYERQSLDDYKRMRTAYQTCAAKYASLIGQRIVSVSAERSAEQVHEQLFQYLFA